MIEWISVEDKLHGNNEGRVMVKNKEKIEEAYFIAWEEGYYFCIGQDVKQTWQPTHWHALPTFTKEK